MAGTKSDPLALDAGRLRQVVQLQAQTMTPDAETGEPSQAWETVLETRAEIRTASSKEAYQAQQFSAQVSHVVTIRWPGQSPVIRGGMRVQFGSRYFTLQYPDNVLERNRVLQLYCMEINGVANA